MARPTMFRSFLSKTACVVLASSGTCAYAAALPPTFAVIWKVDGLPGTVTKCRDENASSQSGYDERWGVAIDIDDDSSTGNANGNEVLVDVKISAGGGACVSEPGMEIEQVLLVTMAVWDPTTNQFWTWEQSYTAHVDVTAGTISVSNAMTRSGFDPIVLSASSKVRAFAYASYTYPLAPNFTRTSDNTAQADFGAAITDAQGDVTTCYSPNCDPAFDWVRMVDVTGLTTGLDRVFGDDFEP